MAEAMERKTPVSKDTLPSVAYNTYGLDPTACVFNVDVEKLRKIFLDICQGYVDEITTITFQPDKAGNVTPFAWIHKNSKHLQDASNCGPDAMARVPITRYSKELKLFIDKFCPGDKKRVFRQAEDGGPLKAIVLDVEKFIAIIFDAYGSEYAKVNKDKGAKTTLRVRWEFERHGGNQYDRLVYLTVEKRVARRTSGMLIARAPVKVQD